MRAKAKVSRAVAPSRTRGNAPLGRACLLRRHASFRGSRPSLRRCARGRPASIFGKRVGLCFLRPRSASRQSTWQAPATAAVSSRIAIVTRLMPFRKMPKPRKRRSQTAKGNYRSLCGRKERTVLRCVGDPPVSMAVLSTAFPVTRSSRTLHSTCKYVKGPPHKKWALACRPS